MGIFDDKQYDELDWVSQAVQPIISPLTQILESIPERVDIGALIMANSSLYGMNISDMVGLVIKVASNNDLKKEVSWSDRHIIEECFMIEMSEDDVTLDYEKGTLSSPIFLVKTKFTLEDDKLKTTMGSEGLGSLRNIASWRMDMTRCNHMLDLLEKCEDAMRSRSPKIKRVALLRRIEAILQTNEWIVKSTDLANKVGLWIGRYVEHGDLAALSNITRLKVITYKGAPIYSIEEQK